MWTGQAANLSPWSPWLWLPFPLGIPSTECPGGFPCPEQHLGPWDRECSPCSPGREEGNENPRDLGRGCQLSGSGITSLYGLMKFAVFLHF